MSVSYLVIILLRHWLVDAKIINGLEEYAKISNMPDELVASCFLKCHEFGLPYSIAEFKPK